MPLHTRLAMSSPPFHLCLSQRVPYTEGMAYFRIILRALPGLVLIAAALASYVSSHAPMGGWVGYDAIPDRASLVVDWRNVTHPERFPHCDGRTANVGLADRVVIRESGDAVRMTFGQLARATDAGHRVWVVGSCR